MIVNPNHFHLVKQLLRLPATPGDRFLERQFFKCAGSRQAVKNPGLSLEDAAQIAIQTTSNVLFNHLRMRRDKNSGIEIPELPDRSDKIVDIAGDIAIKGPIFSKVYVAAVKNSFIRPQEGTMPRAVTA